MTFFEQSALKIIKEQEVYIGEIAWIEAGKVEGLKIINKEPGLIEIVSEDPHSIVDILVKKYERIFGQASNEISRGGTNLTHVYFYAAPTAENDLKQSYGLISNTLAQTDLFVTTNYKVDEVQVATEVVASPQLDQMDAFIIEGTTSDPEIGFLLAHAMAMKKPALYLYRRGTVSQVFTRLSRRELPGYIKVVAYENDNLDGKIKSFLKTIEGLVIKEIPRIKFTLRVTNSIEDYLHYKTHNTKLSKADYLREQIEKIMLQDKDYEDYRVKRNQV